MGKIKDTGLTQDELLIFEQGGKGRKGQKGNAVIRAFNQ